MESVCVNEEKTVIHELIQGIEMAKQLRLHLDSAEARQFLIQNILSSYDKALFLLKSPGQPRATPLSSISTCSPQSTEFEFDQSVVSKKRKLWEDEVKILSDNELEGNTINDCYSWRKYGQKDILGAKFPRSYYKCSYRKVHNCLATKQVMRTDENPKVFEITYKGIHTCNHIPQSPPPSPISLSEKQERKPAQSPPPPPSENQEKEPTHDDQLSSPNSSEVHSDFRADELGATSSSFSFPSKLFGFSDDDLHPLYFPNLFDELLQGYSPPFISPASTSESNYFAEWFSSSSLDFPTDSADLYPDFTS